MALRDYRVFYGKWPNLNIVKDNINNAFVISMNSKEISKDTLRRIDKAAHKVHDLMDQVRREVGSAGDPPYYDALNMKWARLK
jgi:hypothetical protein